MSRPTGRALGIGLIALSTALYLALFAVPFLPLTTEAKLALSGVLVLAGEASFWIGGALLGREVVRRFRSYLNPLRWFRRDRNDESQDRPGA